MSPRIRFRSITPCPGGPRSSPGCGRSGTIAGVTGLTALTASRLRSQLLGGAPATSAEGVVHRLLAVQAQDPRAFRLAVRARSTGCSADDVDAALSRHRSLVVSWLCRGTLHLVGPDDYWWLHALTAPRQLAGNSRRLAELGLSPARTERAISVVLAEVSGGPRTRAELAAALEDAGLPTAGQRLVHMLAAASLHAHLVRGPVREGQHCFVDADAWLAPPATPPDRDTCLRRLALRYLAGHGPARPADLAAFCGVTLTDARAAFRLVAGDTRSVGADLRCLADDPGAEAYPPPRLLGMFDPVLHGWADRSFVVGDHKDVVTTNGMFRATALVDGRVAGTWSLPGGVVTLRPLTPLAPSALPALEAEAAAVLEFLGLPPSPLRVEPV